MIPLALVFSFFSLSLSFLAFLYHFSFLPGRKYVEDFFNVLIPFGISIRNLLRQQYFRISANNGFDAREKKTGFGKLFIRYSYLHRSDFAVKHQRRAIQRVSELKIIFKMLLWRFICRSTTNIFVTYQSTSTSSMTNL